MKLALAIFVFVFAHFFNDALHARQADRSLVDARIALDKIDTAGNSKGAVSPMRTRLWLTH